MYRFVDDLLKMYRYRGKNNRGENEGKTAIHDSLSFNLLYLRNSFHQSPDLVIHEIGSKPVKVAVICIDNLISKDILSRTVLKPLQENPFQGEPSVYLEKMEHGLLYINDVKKVHSFEEVYTMLLSGCALIAVEGASAMTAVGVQGFETRGISEPESDVIQRGSKEGFVEPIRTNMTLLRRKLKSVDLTFEMLTVGSLSQTELCLCYLRGTASPKIIAMLKERLRRCNLKTVLSAGYLAPYLEGGEHFSMFSTVGITERPDTVCGKLTEGRIAVLIDGVPTALIVPYLFAEYFQTLDDYSNKPYFAVFTRWLKYAAFLISMLLPGIFTALGTFDPEMFPTLMLNKIAGAIGDTPLSLMSETILILLVYEMMRESGLRMPQPLGYAVSIVGGLVIGDTAVNAGLIGAPTLMVAAVSAICSYIIPNLYAPTSVLRILFTLAGGLLGIWGIAVLLCFVLIGLCSRNSFGVPFTSPFSPVGYGLFRDVLFRADWKTLSAKTNKVQDMPGADLKDGVAVE